MTTTDATPRLRKRGRSYTLDGEPLPSVTTILREGFPAPALVTWAARETAGYAVDTWEQLAQLSPSQRLRELESAAWKRRDQAAAKGTDIHELGVDLAHGRPVQVPEHLLEPVQAYARRLDAFHVVPVIAERPVVNISHRLAGTIDLRANLGTQHQDWLLDLKTGKGVYESHALQIAAYAHAEHWLNEDGQLQPWELPEQCGVVHIRDGEVQLVPTDFSERTYRTFRHAAEVAKWAHEASQAYKDRRPWPVGLALNPPAA